MSTNTELAELRRMAVNAIEEMKRLSAGTPAWVESIREMQHALHPELLLAFLDAVDAAEEIDFSSSQVHTVKIVAAGRLHRALADLDVAARLHAPERSEP